MLMAENIKMWEQFIDPKDWEQALRAFPKSPWQFYLEPYGRYSRGDWGYFKKAFKWIDARSQRFSYPFSPKESLNIETLTTISSLLQFGVINPWRTVVRDNDLALVTRPYQAIKPVFSSKAPLFLNSDNVELKVLGFVPKGQPMVDIIVLGKKLKGLTPEKKGKALRALLSSAKLSIQPKVTPQSDLWGILFPYRQSEILGNLERVLNWYYSHSDSIMCQHRPGTVAYERAVIKLAVKMQRFVDMTHFSFDASGRTSKLIQSYICLLFGLVPIRPVLYRYKNHWRENGTYLPLSRALDMARKGYQRGT
jgi:hypothetical protein